MLGGGDKTAMLKDRRIRIITISEIRYEGNLYQVNSNDKTIALKDVIAFGTEDRPAPQVIPPSQTVYEVIIFKASHIKHLEVLSQEEQARATVQAQQGSAPVNPQVPEAARVQAPMMPAPSMPLPKVPVSESPAPQTDKSHTGEEKKRTPANNRRKEDSDEEPEYVPKRQTDDHQEDREYNSYKRGGDRDQDRGYNGSSGYGSKRGGHQKDRERYIPKEEGGKGVALGEREPQGSRRDKGPKDFDFDEMVEKNNLLEKEKEVKEKVVEQKDAGSTSKYNFDDFFDNLSTSIGDKPEVNGKDPYHQYRTNNETFGFQKKKFNPQNGRGGRGGRGNYGGGYGGRGQRDGYNDHRDRDDDGYQTVGSHRGGSYRGDRGGHHYDRDRRDRSPGQGDYRPKYSNDEGYSRGGRGRGRTSRGASLPDGY